jgi:cytoskeletal protein CcmA (bactofilin family)
MKIVYKHKVFSGALQLTVFIGVVIALLLAGLMFLTYTHTFFIQQSKELIENIQISNSGIHFLLKNETLTADTIEQKGISTENQKVYIQKSQWGVFEKGIVKAVNRKKVFYKCALLGTHLSKEDRPTIYLQDNFKPLVLVAKTNIKGLVFLPGQGVKSGYIAGESYYGQELIHGITKRSDVKLPRLNPTFTQQIGKLFNDNESNETNFIAIKPVDKISISFLKPTKWFYSKESIQLGNTIITGNCIIKSENKIIVKNTAQLKDILLIAPIIEIEEGVTGNFQAIANKSIVVGKNCKLSYPSALVLLQDTKGENNPVLQKNDNQIFIDKNAEIKGIVCYLKSKEEESFKTQLVLEEKATIKGEIYCQGNLELKGTVCGSVFTEQFIVNRAGSIFINHIYNGQIIEDNFPEKYCGILFENKEKRIAKWMY